MGLFSKQKTGHYRVKCCYCFKEWAKGEPVKLEIYLGYERKRCPENVKLLGYKIIDKQKNYQRTSSTKRKKNLISHFKNDEPLLLIEQNFFGSSRTEVMGCNWDFIFCH